MPLTTTVIGSFPKPAYLKIPDWFQPNHTRSFTADYSKFLAGGLDESEKLIVRAIKETIQIQTEAGLDVITDGEMRRESYVLHFCRALEGFDFVSLFSKSFRDGACTLDVPRIVSKVYPREKQSWVWREWKISQDLSNLPVKITLLGPMTVIDSVESQYYKDHRKLGGVLAKILNAEIRALAIAGCKHIQVDEPVLMRFPDIALEHGIEQLKMCFEGVPKGVVKTVHLCCGYPNYLDQEDYKKADKGAYLQLANKLDTAGFDEISIEDAHRHNDLSLFEHFKNSKVVVGVVKIANSRVESVEEIRDRLKEILTVLPAERLVVAPDCGLGFLPSDLAKRKLCNMVQAAKSLP